MSVRGKCLRKGHRVKPVMVALPFVFCSRWFCDWSEVTPGYPMSPGLREAFQETADEKNAEAMGKVVL